MIECCNNYFNPSFSYILFSGKNYYRRLEFGICQNCGCLKFKDFAITQDGKEIVKIFTGKHAAQKLEMWRKRLRNTGYGNKTNQHLYYGDFRKTNRKDINGIPIYQQLRRNFNGQAEVIGEIKTNVFTLLSLRG